MGYRSGEDWRRKTHHTMIGSPDRPAHSESFLNVTECSTCIYQYDFIGCSKCKNLRITQKNGRVNPLNPELNPICYLLALLGDHHFLHVSRIRVKLLNFRRLSHIYIYIYIYIYMEHPFLMFLDHTQRRSTVGRTPLDE